MIAVLSAPHSVSLEINSDGQGSPGDSWVSVAFGLGGGVETASWSLLVVAVLNTGSAGEGVTISSVSDWVEGCGNSPALVVDQGPVANAKSSVLVDTSWVVSVKFWSPSFGSISVKLDHGTLDDRASGSNTAGHSGAKLMSNKDHAVVRKELKII